MNEAINKGLNELNILSWETLPKYHVGKEIAEVVYT